uniref:E-beta-farnesene synthase n=1 Tax=Tanacetum cinerariifolium TaxID=118510 RepID=A0A6L2LDE7_TANCI|nr:hypothetical protein [Tanacetum cinerariifolium]
MMANLSDSEDIQCAGFDHDHYQEAACAYHKEHIMHECVQLDHVVDSHDEYTSDGNIIMCDQYVRDNEVPVVHSGALSVPTYAFMMIYDDMCEPHDQSVSYSSQNKVVKNSLTAELAIYKEHVELGFEQTKACYLQEVIPFFKTLKDNFEGIQKAETKEVKDMKDVFEELEAKVAQYVVDRKHDAIKLKNLLIANDNLITECLSQEVFCVATNSELNVARFTDMHVANTIAETRCLALEAELANLRETNNQDNQMELINHFSKLKTTDSQITKLTDQVTHLQAQNDLFRAENDKIKQHYKELYDSIKIIRAKHIEQVIYSSLRFGHVLGCVLLKVLGCDLLENVLGCVLLKVLGCDLLENVLDTMADVNAPSDQTPTMAPPVRADDQILPHIRANIDYAERIWEEFAQSIHTFIEDKQNLSRHTLGKKRATLIVIPSIRFTKLIIHHLQRKHKFHPRPDFLLHLSNEEPVLGYLKFNAKDTKREIFKMPIPGRLITANIREASYYQEYQENVAKHRGFLAGETGSTQDLPTPKPAKPARKPQSTTQKCPLKPLILSLVTSTQPAPTSVPAKTQENKRKQATGITDKLAKAKRIKRSASRKTRKPRSSPKSVGASEAEEVPTKEPQVANKDADFQMAVEESMKDAYALLKGPLPPVVIREPESGKYQPLPEVPGKGKAKVFEEQVAHDLLSLQKHKKTSLVDQYIFQRRVSKPTTSSFHDESPYEVLGQSDSEEESEKIVLGVKKGGQDEGQAGPDPNAQAEEQTGSDTGAQAEGLAGSNPNETSEGQAGSNPDETSKGQARLDPGNTEARVQSTSSPVVHAGSDREHIDRDVANVSPQPSTEQLYEGFIATIYPNVQENLKLAIEEPVLLEEPTSSAGTLSSLQHLSRDFSFGDQFFSDKHSDANKSTKTKVESMQLKATTTDTTTTTTTTTTLPPPQAPQQSMTEAMMVKRIGELEHILADMIQVSIAVSKVVMDAVDWAMQAPLCNHFRDLPEADMKEILQQRMWESDSHKSHEDHMKLFEALENSINRDHSEELAHDLAEAWKKRKKGRELPKMPPRSPSHQPPPPPSPAGPSGTSRAPRAFGSQVTTPPPPPTSTNQNSPSKGSTAPSPSKTAATTKHQAWTTPDITLKPLVSLTLEDLDMDEAMGSDEQAQLSDEEDIGSAHIRTTDDITTFMDWFCKRRGITELKPQDLEGPAYEIVKVFHSDVIHLQYQMEECHKLLTDSVDDPILRHNVSKPLPLGGPPGHVTIQSDFFFNKDLEYLRYGS